MFENGALSGVRIIEFAYFVAGPVSDLFLAEMGAEVIKVESNKRPDRWRMFVTAEGFPPHDLVTGGNAWDVSNLNKKDVLIDITKPEGRDLALRLVAKADVVVENMTPGIMEKHGLGYEDMAKVKPDIIYMSSSACGQTGPERDFVGYAPIFANKTGLGHLTGYADGLPSFFLATVDVRSAALAAYVLLAAILHHQKTGEGQYIDLASQEAIGSLLGDTYLDYILNGTIQSRQGNKHDVYAPHDCYRCAGEDKWVSIAVTNEEEWQALCQAMGKAELASDERFNSSSNRKTNERELDAIISEWTKEKDYYVVADMLQEAGVAAAPSLDSEGLFNDPHIRERGCFVQFDHPGMGKDWALAPPWNLSETPAKIMRHGPTFGEHTVEVFEEIVGLTKQEIKELQEAGILF